MVVLDELAAAPFTYPQVGATAGELPAGYWHLRRSRRVGTGRADFDRAADAVLRWRMQRSVGLPVRTSTERAAVGSVVVLGAGPLRIPCRVVYLVEERDRAGFAYGTLPGHPESGEERFTVTIDDSTGEVTAEVLAFARAAGPARLVGPVLRVAARLISRRYLGSVDVH